MQEPGLCEKDYVRFYDWIYSPFRADIAWFLDLARRRGTPVLEIACGTGRVALPLARAGLDVVGLDLSEPMLELVRRKCEDEAEMTRKALSFVRADMREFSLGRSFPCVIVPNASLLNLQNINDLRKCLSCLFTHTRPGGVLAVDVIPPPRITEREVGKLYQLCEGVNPQTGLATKEFNRIVRLDRQRQLVKVEHLFIERNGEDEKLYTFNEVCRWLEENEGVSLLVEAGFSEIQTMGDYSGAAFSKDAERLIFLAKK